MDIYLSNSKACFWNIPVFGEFRFLENSGFWDAGLKVACYIFLFDNGNAVVSCFSFYCMSLSCCLPLLVNRGGLFHKWDHHLPLAKGGIPMLSLRERRPLLHGRRKEYPSRTERRAKTASLNAERTTFVALSAARQYYPTGREKGKRIAFYRTEDGIH